MRLFVGLGNPGPEYAGTRHNIGFMAADVIVRRHSFSDWRRRFRGEWSEGLLDHEKVGVLKPLTYMNESGRAVQEAAHFFKVAPADIVVFHDEIDLAPGKLRTKVGGGAAGNNGIRSIDRELGTPDYARVRLGVGHPGDRARVHNWVLGSFTAEEKQWVEPMLAAVADAAPLLLADLAKFQNKVAVLLQPPPPNAGGPKPPAAKET